jgi:hypothetical protein
MWDFEFVKQKTKHIGNTEGFESPNHSTTVEKSGYIMYRKLKIVKFLKRSNRFTSKSKKNILRPRVRWKVGIDRSWRAGGGTSSKLGYGEIY